MILGNSSPRVYTPLLDIIVENNYIENIGRWQVLHSHSEIRKVEVLNTS